MEAKDVMEMRTKLNLSQEGFAQLIGVSKNTVYNWESGSKIPQSKLEMLSKISQRNEVDVIDDFNSKEQNEVDDKMLRNRIKTLCDSEGIAVAAFERSIEASNGYVNSITKNIGLEKLLKILDVYPNVNLNWLTTGQGDMYKVNTISESGFVYQHSSLESLYHEDEVEIFTNSHGNNFYIYPDDTIKIEVPMMIEPAYAGYKECFTDGPVTEIENLPKTIFKVDRIGKGNYMAFTIKNNSMWNGGGFDTPSGAEVLGREVGKHLWSNGFRRTDYGFILLTSKGIYHKDIKSYDLERGIVILESRNPEDKEFEFYIDDIFKVFNVIKRAF